MTKMCTENIARNATREHTTVVVVYLNKFAYTMAALTSCSTETYMSCQLSLFYTLVDHFHK